MTNVYGRLFLHFFSLIRNNFIIFTVKHFHQHHLRELLIILQRDNKSLLKTTAGKTFFNFHSKAVDVSKDRELIWTIFIIQKLFFLLHFKQHRTRRETKAFLLTINISPQKENSLIKHLHFLLLFFGSFFFAFLKQQPFHLRRSTKWRNFFCFCFFTHFTQQKEKFSMHGDYELFIKMGAKRIFSFLLSLSSLFFSRWEKKWKKKPLLGVRK